MEGPTETATAQNTFSQVVFMDILKSYLPSTHIACSYTLVEAFQPNPRDWVGIFKVGWSTTKDYHTFVWVEPCLDVIGERAVVRQAVFKEYYLPKDEVEFYQFCYVDSGGQVRGASTPFCFRSQSESSMDINTDDDLLVITTQEQVEQNVREKAELQKELSQKSEEIKSLQSVLEKKEEESAGVKEQTERKEKEYAQLQKEMDQFKEENESLKSTLQQQLTEKDHLQEEMKKIQQQNTMSDGATKQNETQSQEKYDRAVLKINQLKEERKELREKLEVRSVEISKQKSKLAEVDLELLTLKDNIQLLQVDLQSNEREKENVCAELHKQKSETDKMAALQRENQELTTRLAHLEALQDCHTEDDLRLQYQTAVGKLQDTQGKLAVEKEKCTEAKRRAESLERDIQQIRAQLESVSNAYDKEQHKGGKYEILLREAHGEIANKDETIEEKERVVTLVRREVGELTSENQRLQSDIEGLRRHFEELHEAADTHTGEEPRPGSTDTPQEAPEQPENIYENIDQQEEALVCSHCQEVFPMITRAELEQHEQSHRVCPFCTMICDGMEQGLFEDHVYSHEV